MKRRINLYLNGIFKTPYVLELSPILIITLLNLILSAGTIVRIEIDRRILQAVFSLDGNALCFEIICLAVYELVYSATVRFQNYKYAKIEGNIYRQLLNRIMDKNEKLRSLSNCPMGANDRFSMASEDCSGYVSAVVSKASLFTDFIIMPCYILYGCSINIGITAAITVVGVILSMVNRGNKKKLYGYNQEYNERYGRWINYLWKAVDNLEVIKVFLDKRKIRDEQRKRSEALDETGQSRLKTWLDMTLIEEASDMIFTLFVLCAGFFGIARKMILVSDILAMVESLNIVQKVIFALPEKIIQLNELESMAARISRYAGFEEEDGQAGEIEGIDCISLKQVFFSYEGKEVLKGIDFTFEKGKFYILAGESGCGKSTLLKVIAKLIPYAGSVCWNQTELATVSRQALYDRLSYQAQNQVFLEDSIRENICLNAEEDEKRYEQILDTFFIREIFEKNGFDDTQVLTFRGNPLSSGEGQMVSMAGILYGAKDVVLLDEVFSAVDPAKEQVYFRKLSSLAEAGKLVILVSHRLTNLEMVDEILFMEEGRIRERGNLRVLMAAEGKFCEWYRWNRERSGG